MLKLASRIYDIYDDSSAEIASQLGAEYASLKIASADEIDALSDTQFGLVLKTSGGAVRRRYALHDADSLKLSRAYFDKVKSTLPEEIVICVEAKLASAEAGEEQTKVAYVDGTALVAGKEKVAFAEKHWGLTIDGRNMFPLHDADLVKTAESRFRGSIEWLEPEEAFLYARNIAKRAAALGVAIPLDSHINLYTGDTVNLAALKTALDDRYRIMKAAGQSIDILDQLAVAAGCEIDRGSIESQDSYARRCKIANRMATEGISTDPAQIIRILQNVDKMAGFGRNEYLRGMLDPFAACFKLDTFTKRAALIVDGIDLSCVTPDALAQKFDPEFCGQFAQQPVNAYNSLPDPMKGVLRGIACPQQPTPAATPADTTATGQSDPMQQLDPSYVNSRAISS
jgi:hypothetical protein